MRRRGYGIGGLQKERQQLQLFQQKGALLAKQELDRLTEQMAKFKTSLEMFATKHRKEIKRSGEFRRQFQLMCASAGVDPLQSSTSYWSKILGFGDFYYKLAIQINEVFMSTQQVNGGIIPIEELHKKVAIEGITHYDILEGIKKLSQLGANIKIVESNGSYIIHATASELNSDQIDIVQLAHVEDGHIVPETVQMKLGWTGERIEKVLNELVMEGVVWVDEFENQHSYWFPSLRTSCLSSSS